jgi:hypothetical protein
VAVGNFMRDFTLSLKDWLYVTSGCFLVAGFGLSMVGKRIALAIDGKTSAIRKFRAASSAAESTFLRRFVTGQSRYWAPNFNDCVKASWFQPTSACCVISAAICRLRALRLVFIDCC